MKGRTSSKERALCLVTFLLLMIGCGKEPSGNEIDLRYRKGKWIVVNSDLDKIRHGRIVILGKVKKSERVKLPSDARIGAGSFKFEWDGTFRTYEDTFVAISEEL